MRAYFQLLCRRTRYRWPFFWPLLIVLFSLWVGLWREYQQQQTYQQEVKIDLQQYIDSFGKQHVDNNYQANLKLELAAYQKPEQYFNLYLHSLKVIAANQDQTKDESQPKRGIFLRSTPRKQTYASQELTNTIQELTLVKEWQATPLFPTRLLLNENSQQAYGGSSESWRLNYRLSAARFYDYGWYYLQQGLQKNWGVIVILVVFTLACGSLSLSLRERQAGYQLFKLNRLSACQQYFGSYLYTISTSLALLVITWLIFITGSTVVHGTGSLNYPIAIWQDQHSPQTFQPLWQILLLELFFSLLVLALLAACYQFLLLLVKQEVLAWLLSSAVIATAWLPVFAWWLPSSYFQVGLVVNRYRFVQLQEGQPLLAVAVLLVWTLLLLLAGWLLWQRQLPEKEVAV